MKTITDPVATVTEYCVFEIASHN